MSVTGVTNPTGGTVDLTGGVVTFTPDADLCGDDQGGFDYERLRRQRAGPTPATSPSTSRATNDSPVAVDDDASGTEDTDVTINGADLAANDTDADGDA